MPRGRSKRARLAPRGRLSSPRSAISCCAWAGRCSRSSATRARLEFKDSESAVWRARLQASGEHLQRAARAVGRIDVTGLPDVPYVGTGWLVDKNTIVTNRHVAREFGRRTRGGFTFKKGSGAKPMTASIDFLEEAGRAEQLEFPIVEILHIEDETGPDFALLRVEDRSGGTGARVADPARQLARAARAAGRRDRISRPGQPGARRAADAVDLRRRLRQEAAGAGTDHQGAAGRRVPRLLDARRQLGIGACSTWRRARPSACTSPAAFSKPTTRCRRRSWRPVSSRFCGRGPGGRPGVPHRLPSRQPVVTPATQAGTPAEPELIVEGVPADYVGRTGYDPAFVGPKIPLPVVRNTKDVLTFPWNGRQETVLKYQHFSVVMSRSRRLCIYSAGNIDGSTPRRFKRPSWRLDARIPTEPADHGRNATGTNRCSRAGT